MSIRSIIQHTGLAAYGALARTGVMQQPWARRVFLAVYSAYKTWIESGPVDRLKEFVAPGSAVVDVGANVGFFTLKFARWVGRQGRVIAIEPDELNFTTLAAKIAAAGLQDRVDLHKAAAAAETGSVRLRLNEVHPGDHRISFDDEGIAVSAVTVDGLVAAVGVTTVSLVKIDVQGAEMLVLAGAQRTLATMRPALFVEVDDRALGSFGSSARALIAHLEEIGYRMHELVDNGPPRSLSQQQLSASLGRRSYIDVLFLPAAARPI